MTSDVCLREGVSSAEQGDYYKRLDGGHDSTSNLDPEAAQIRVAQLRLAELKTGKRATRCTIACLATMFVAAAVFLICRKQGLI